MKELGKNKRLVIFGTITLITTLILLMSFQTVSADDCDDCNYDENHIPRGVIPLVDTGWSGGTITNDCGPNYYGWCDDQWQLTLTSSAAVTIYVGDIACPGDFYEVYIDGFLIGTTPDLSPPWGCSYTGPMSSGSFTVLKNPGTYLIEIRDAGFDGHTPAEIVAESMCPAGFMVTISVEKQELDLFKEVWDPTYGWVRYTEAQVCTNVRFRIAIHNDGDTIAEDIYVYDWFDPCLEYVPGTAIVNGIPYEPDWIWIDPTTGEGYMDWYLGWSLYPCEWIYIEFDMHVTECGINENWAIADFWSPVFMEYLYSNEGSAVVWGYGIPSIDVEKYVWNPDTYEYVQPDIDNPLDFDHGSIVEFKIVIHNDGICCDLINIWVFDFMDDSLEPVDWTWTPDAIYTVPGGTELGWTFPGPLEPCNTIVIYLWAEVVGKPCSVDRNYVYAEGFCPYMYEYVWDEDEVFIHVKCVPEVWVDDDYHTGTPGWDVTHYYTIHDALEALEPGGTAHIHQGIYPEDVIVNDVPCDNTGILIEGVEGYPKLPKQTGANVVGTIALKVPDVTINYLIFNPTSDAAVSVEGSTIQHNIFLKECLDDATGVENLERSTVEARFNYWGAPNGPSGGVTDPVTGMTAEGYGVLLIGDNIRFDPWAGVHADITASQTEIEAGDSIIFNSEPGSFAYFIDGTPNEYDVLWDFGDGYYSQDKLITHVFDAPGSYHVSLRVRANDTSLHPGNHMYDWDYMVITVKAPGAPLTANAGGGSLKQYETEINTDLSLLGSAAGGTPPYTYSWDLGDDRTTEGDKPIVKYEAEGTYSVTLTVKDQTGETATDTSQITVLVPEETEEEESEVQITNVNSGLTISAIIKSTSEPVTWSIETEGIILLGGEAQGEIPIDTSQKVKLPLTFGLGRVAITITANDLTKHYTALMLGPLFLSLTET